ncbi:MAG: galactose mutarotase [Bacteroidetes bacterium]|nr:galactose mutarotase [Bacteroidota bacterium]MBS1632975.1 galactose mutarotase [Bacteroidota bacterium]
MNLSRHFRFTHPSGEDIYLFALKSTKGHEVWISNYGCIINSMKIRKANGSYNDIVLGFDKLEDYLSDTYLKNYMWMGCAVGRYANRIKDAACVIDGKKYQLSKNLGNDQLHGGIEGFDKKIWNIVNFEPVKNELELKYKSPDGEEGYPGNLMVHTKIRLEEDELSFEYEATTDQTTIINLTRHEYFNLNNGYGNNHDYLIRINSSEILEQDTNLITTGGQLNGDNTAFDFRQLRKIGNQAGMENGYDKSFVLEKRENELTFAGEAICEETRTGLQVLTTEPILHFYSGKGIPGISGKNNTKYSAYSGFCFETHKHPNAINIPHFPDTILRPGEKYYEKTVYRFFEA